MPKHDEHCVCGHWPEEHDGTCHAPDCSCDEYRPDPEQDKGDYSES